MKLMSPEAEQSLIGALACKPEAFTDVADILTDKDFAIEANGEIFKAMGELEKEGKAFDILAIADKLGSRLDINYLSKVLMATPSHTNLMTYAKIVAERAALRRLFDAYYRAQDILENSDLPMGRRAEAAIDLISSSITSEDEKAKTMHIKEGMAAWFNHLEELSKSGGKITGIPSGFPDLDKRTKGWHSEEMIVVAARPGMGKTNLALNMSNAALRAGKTVLFFSLEMSKEQLYSRMAASAKGILLEQILSADFDKMGPGVTAFTAEFKELPFFINDRSNHTMASIRNECKKIKRRHGLDMVVIDYLGLIEGEGKSAYEKVSDISRKVKLLAKEMQCPVVILAQLNRAVDSRADKTPVMADLRDSGAIEQDADVILFPFRPDAYEPDPAKHKNEGSIIVAKLRHGEPGQVPVVVDFAKARFLPAALENYDWMTRKARPQEDDEI